MKIVDGVKYYYPHEEKLNIITHGIGMLLSVLATILLVRHALLYGSIVHLIGFSVFGTSLILLYSASTLYHSVQKIELRKKLRIADHASIYILIAGTYTPFALIILKGAAGLKILIAIWVLALLGIILKLFFTGKYNLLSTITYVAMSWIIVFAIKPLVENFSTGGLSWLFGGGLFYTFGALIYSNKKVILNHALFHVMVLLGSFCHFISVYFYVLPVG